MMLKGKVKDNQEQDVNSSVPTAWFNRGGVHDTQGKPGEETFKSLAEREGWVVSEASRNQNLREHWDFLIQRKEEVLRVEVKGRKKILRADRHYNDQLVWIEFLNSWGNPGWLYGRADIVSFDFEGYLVLCHREALRCMCERLVDLVNPSVTSPSDALYRRYTRMDRSDCLALIKTSDLLQSNVLWDVWFK